MMEPVLPPTFIREFDSQRERISNAERLLKTKTEELYLVNKPAAINFVKYARANTNFDGTKTPSKVDRIQSNWVSLPYPINISSVYVTHKTEHLNTPSFQDFYRCQIVVTSADLQPYKVLSEFTISLNKLNNLRSNPKAGLWQDEPLENESEEERYFQYEKQTGFEIKLPETVSIPADRRFSLIKYPIFAIEEDFALTDDDNLDIDVVVLNGLSSKPINITVESTLIKKVLPVNYVVRTFRFTEDSESFSQPNVLQRNFVEVTDEVITQEEVETIWANYLNPPQQTFMYDTKDFLAENTQFFKGRRNFFVSPVSYPLDYSPGSYEIPFSDPLSRDFVGNYTPLTLWFPEPINWSFVPPDYPAGTSINQERIIKHVLSSPYDTNNFSLLSSKVIIRLDYDRPLRGNIGDLFYYPYGEGWIFEKTLDDYNANKNTAFSNPTALSNYLDLTNYISYPFFIDDDAVFSVSTYVWDEESKNWTIDLQVTL